MARDKTSKLLRDMKKGTPTRNIPLGVGVEIPDLSGIASNQAFKKIKIEDLKTDIPANRIPYSDGSNLTSTANFSINPTTFEVTISGTHDGTLLTLESTDADAGSGPDFVLHRNSASPAAADFLGVMVFAGDDSAGNYQEYGRLQGRILDPTSTSEDGSIRLAITKAGTFNVNALDVGPTTIVFNEDQKDIDVRVESDTNANFVHFDAGNFGGAGSIAFGQAADEQGFVRISPDAYTSAANTSAAHCLIQATGITVPTGTTPIVASLRVKEPTITATGTVNNAATVYIQDAPTEGTDNYALWVNAGDARLDGNLGLNGNPPTPQSSPIMDPIGGATVDAEARQAITDLLDYLRTRGDVAP